MRKKNAKGRTTASCSVTVPLELRALIDCAAVRAGRNRSNFLSWLIAQEQQKEEGAKAKEKVEVGARIAE
jgi:hypothetical protein